MGVGTEARLALQGVGQRWPVWWPRWEAEPGGEGSHGELVSDSEGRKDGPPW